MIKDLYSSYKTRKLRSRGLSKLIKVYMETDKVVSKYREMPLITRHYTDRVFDKYTKNLDGAHMLDPELHLILRQDAYKEGILFQKSNLWAKLKMWYNVT